MGASKVDTSGKPAEIDHLQLEQGIRRVIADLGLKTQSDVAEETAE